MAVRPSRVLLGEDAAVGTAMDQNNAMAGRIQKSTYVGSHMEYQVQTDYGTLFVTSEVVNRPLAAGADVAVSFAEHGPVLLARAGDH
jgi:iron(III) transport system ATP-binding protein